MTTDSPWHVKIPAWGWILFGVVDWSAKVGVMRAVGYTHAQTMLSAVTSTSFAIVIGLIAYQPFARANAITYGQVYAISGLIFAFIVSQQYNVTEVRFGMLMAEGGHWTFAGTLVRIFMGAAEAAFSTIVLLVLQRLLASWNADHRNP